MSHLSFGFILTRHVNSEVTNHYWQTAYAYIRKLYPDTLVLVIDDNSDYNYVQLFSHTPPLTDFTVIQSEYPKCGELLAYYYFWKIRPFQRAIIIHDSVFVKSLFVPILSKTLSDPKLTAKFLWHFPHHFNNYGEEQDMLSLLPIESNLKNDVLYFHSLQHEWKGMFGVMSVIDYSFLDHLSNKFKLFDAWLNHINNRNRRYTMERVLAVLCCIEDRLCCMSLFGDIFEWPHNYTYSWNQFFNNSKNASKITEYMPYLPVIKVWTGR